MGTGDAPTGTFGLTQPLPHSHWHALQPVGAASLISKGARAQEILDFTVEINPGIAN
ncbi:MAG: hypothetical protein MUC60_00765 [Oscillatoria sp. Prado101]|nr:hypothetical protein [Oscillatoria sp. Prado101]